MSDAEARPALDSRNLAVRDDVAEVRRYFHPEGDRQPDRVEVTQLVQDAPEARRPGDSDRRTECERRPDPDEDRVLRRVTIEVRRRPQKDLEGHPLRIGHTAACGTPSWVTISSQARIDCPS